MMGSVLIQDLFWLFLLSLEPSPVLGGGGTEKHDNGLLLCTQKQSFPLSS